MERENQLLEDREIREKNIERVEVLEQVGELLLLPNTELATIEMVAKYYSTKNKVIDIDTVKKVVSRNKNELIANGYRLYRKAEIEEILKGQNVTLEKSMPNWGLNLFSKRAILNIGMLLRDSEVAKDIRSRLLDIVHDSEQGQGNIETIINEISEEKQLMLQRIEAEMNGNFDEVCVINAKLFALKNKRISELEDEIKIITENSLTIKEARKVINRLVRIIAMKEFSGAFGKAYSELYSKVNYQLGINIKARNKKSNQSYIEVLTEEETFSVEKIVRTWANNIGIDVEKELKIS